jgi:uncharacterized membrane protein YdjX (TVP38/TMEM64 family)
MNKRVRQWLPVLILITGLILFFAFGGKKYLSFDMLSQNYKTLNTFTANHYFLSALIFISIYIIIAAFSIPGATIITLFGGFLFGPVFGTFWVVIGATIGATITFLAVKTAFGNILKNKKEVSNAKNTTIS